MAGGYEEQKRLDEMQERDRNYGIDCDAIIRKMKSLPKKRIELLFIAN